MAAQRATGTGSLDAAEGDRSQGRPQGVVGTNKGDDAKGNECGEDRHAQPSRKEVDYGSDLGAGN